MTTSHVLGPDEPLPNTVSYDVPIDPDLLKLSPAAQDEVEVLLKQLLAIFHIRGKMKEFNSKAMLVKHTATGQCCISRCLNMPMKSPLPHRMCNIQHLQWHRAAAASVAVACQYNRCPWCCFTRKRTSLAIHD